VLRGARTRACVAGALALATALPELALEARADTPAAGAADAGAPATVASGVAVLARAGAEDAAWALAKEVYARSSLRPLSLDEARARIMVGGSPASGAPQAVKDLADERAGVRGDDGASRALLRTIAAQLGVRAIVVVEQMGASASARVFVADSGDFDAARYDAEPGLVTVDGGAVVVSSPVPVAAISDAGAPSDGAAASDGSVSMSAAPAPPPPPPRWTKTVASLDRAYGIGGPETHAPALATSAVPPLPPPHPESHPFYTSPWFWGAVGAAAFGGVAVYFATRDNQTDTIHLELQAPK
jgi:hypothetical protein